MTRGKLQENRIWFVLAWRYSRLYFHGKSPERGRHDFVMTCSMADGTEGCDVVVC